MATAAGLTGEEAARGADRRGAPPLLVWTVVFLACGALLLNPLRLFGDGDTGWHLGAGEWILRHRLVPHSDPFSYASAGMAWTAHEWLAEIVMAGAFRVAGWVGLTILFSAAFALLLLLVGRELARWLPSHWAGTALFMVACVTVPMIHARPHMLAWPLFAGWLVLLLHARERRRLPPWWAPLLMVAWANLHASYLLGLGVAGLVTLDALIDHRRERRQALRWAGWGLLVLAATAITPLGLQGFLYPFQVRGMKALAIITEWRPVRWPDDALFIGYAVLFWLALLTRWRRLAPVRLVLVAGLFAMGLLHVRDQSLFAIGAAVLAAPLGRGEPGEPTMRWGWAAAVFGVMAAVRLAVPWTMPPTPEYPLALIARVPPALRAQPVFNDYSMGGPLIMAGVHPAIDGRADMYGDDYTFAHLAMQRGEMRRFGGFVRRWDVRWTILTRDSPLAARLDREPGWRRLAGDANAIVHVRTR